MDGLMFFFLTKQDETLFNLSGLAVDKIVKDGWALTERQFCKYCASNNLLLSTHMFMDESSD